MELDYTLQGKDWAIFTLYVHRTASRWSCFHWVNHYGLALAYASFGFFAGLLLGEWVVGGAMLALSFAWWVLFPRLLEYRTQQYLQKLEDSGAVRGLLGEYHLQIGKNGLLVRVQGIAKLFPWALVLDIVEHQGYAYLRLSPTKAVVVPLGTSTAKAFVVACQDCLSC